MAVTERVYSARINIGFRDINFGRWLRLLTKPEYDLKAVGWAQTVLPSMRC
jgi:hypothetical protein